MILLALLLASSSPADAPGEPADPRKWESVPEVAPAPGTREVPWVHIVALHTGDTLPVFGDVVPPERLEWLLRCRATGRHAPVAETLGALMLRSARTLHAGVIEIVAGYRSDKFNEQLRKKGRQVASESFHRFGKAIDWRLRGVPLERLRRYLGRVHHGGIGRYPISDFVHIDTGPAREWRGR